MNLPQKFKTAFVLASALAFAGTAGAYDRGITSQPDFSNDNIENTLTLKDTFAAATHHPAQQIIEEASERLMKALKLNKDKLKANPDCIYPLLENHLLKHFDFKIASRLVMAKHWKKASNDQKSRFVEAFRKTAVNSYAKALLMFDDENVEILPYRPLSRDDKAYVRTRIQMDNGNQLAVDYSMYRNKNDKWKIYNVTVEGVSLILTYRGMFNRTVSQHGLEGAIQDMERTSKSISYQQKPEKKAGQGEAPKQIVVLKQ